VCPTKAISWKGEKLFVRGNDIGAPTTSEAIKPLNALLEGKADKTDLASKAEQSELDELSARVEGLEVMSSGGLQAPAGTGMYVYDADKKSWESLTVVVEDAQTNVITNN
jgi:hypothetical protein